MMTCSPGVYCLSDMEGKVLFVGKGKIRERLLSHWNQENSTDEAIWDHGPVTFCFERTTHRAEREAELNQVLKPSCNLATHSKFPKFW